MSQCISSFLENCAHSLNGLLIKGNAWNFKVILSKPIQGSDFDDSSRDSTQHHHAHIVSRTS